jgi:addiction module antitoxin, relB/dinJ family
VRKNPIKQKGALNMAAVMDVNVCVDRDVKEQSEALYGELGIDLTTAINVFLRQSLRVGGFPFEVRVDTPNQETVAALMEAENILSDLSVKRYSDVEEALRALKA